MLTRTKAAPSLQPAPRNDPDGVEGPKVVDRESHPNGRVEEEAALDERSHQHDLRGRGDGARRQQARPKGGKRQPRGCRPIGHLRLDGPARWGHRAHVFVDADDVGERARRGVQGLEPANKLHFQARLPGAGASPRKSDLSLAKGPVDGEHVRLERATDHPNHRRGLGSNAPRVGVHREEVGIVHVGDVHRRDPLRVVRGLEPRDPGIPGGRASPAPPQ
eukprot:8358745-Lingulodinium_polyedra.AAC.2